MNGYTSKDEFLKQTLIEHLLGGLWNPRSPLWERGTLYLFGSLLPNKRNRPYWVCFLLFRLRDGTVPLHDLRRREWAWSASAPCGRWSERDKGKNKEYQARAVRVPETTMFLTGSFKSHPRNQIYTRNRVISGVFLCFWSKNGEWSPALPDYCPQFYHSFLWILHLYFEDSLCTLTNLKMSSKSNCMLRALHILARLQLKQMCVLTTTIQ